MKNKKGFTLIEVLVSIGIISFVIISILNAFAHRIHTDSNTSHRNIAISLTEAKLEEYLKFPSNQLTLTFPTNAVDYIVYSGNKYPKITTDDPGANKQFRRTAQYEMNGTLARITVVVEYGYVAKNDHYPFRVSLTTQRGL